MAAPVSRLLDLPSAERRVILYLRLWCAGASGQTEVWQDLVARIGPRDAAPALRAFEALLLTCAQLARRPLCRRPLACGCASGDECAFARLVGCAADGRPQDARLLAALIAGPSGADALARAAEAAAPGIAAADPPRRAAPPRPSHAATHRPH